jgi:hypothetical protein
MLLMLEDNLDRLARFRAAICRIDSTVRLQFWRNAWMMVKEVEGSLPGARLTSLDHDLEPEEDNAGDPGTGWDVTKFLAALPPACPVIIHTSNRERSSWMCGEFELGGWDYHCVPPFSADWIENDWRRAARSLLKRAR